MKKPSVSNSKKGAIINILWILVENPSNLDYFRISDIKDILIDEFRIELDRKTIMDYINILIDLNLSYDISHDNNKGYYVSKNLINPTKRQILIDTLYEQRSIDLITKLELLDFISSDLSVSNRQIIKNAYFDRYRLNLSNELDLVMNLNTIKKAIEENKMIRFEYLNYNSDGSLMKKSRVYESTPKLIKYNNGMYFLYSSDKVWSNSYCGIKIKYLRNIEILDKTGSDFIHPDLNYSFKLEIIYDWSIEFITDFFNEYKITRTITGSIATICSPFDYAMEWCKTYGHFFIILDEKMKDKVRYDAIKLIESFELDRYALLKIKAAIVDYHYKNPIEDKSSFDGYMLGLYKNIDYYLDKIGYKYISGEEIKLYKVKNQIVALGFVLYEIDNHPLNINNTSEIKKENEFANFNRVYNELINTKADIKVMTMLYSHLMPDEERRVINVLNFNPFLEMDDQFSYYNKAYFYKYTVFKI